MPFYSLAGNYTWTGSADKEWNNPSNWSPSGTPSTNDTVTIGAGSDTLLIAANTTINRLVISGRVVNLRGYQLEISQRASLNGGKIYNGTLMLRGVFAFFQGTNTNCTIDCVVNQIKFSGGTFDGPGTFEQNGTANGWGEGGCTFNAAVSIRKSGTAVLRLGQNNPDVFNSKVTFICSNAGNLEISHGSQSVFRDSVFLNTSHTTAHISFCNSSTLATLEQEAVLATGTIGLANGKITLKALHQTTNKTNTLIGTGNLLVNIDSCRFTGENYIKSPSILIKNNIFNGVTTLIKTTAGTNSYSYGGNIFNSGAVIENQDATRAFRLANETGDTYNSDVKFDTGTNNIQVGYKGNNYFAGNITINSNKVVFNASTGTVILNGSNEQLFYGQAGYSIGKLEINKDAGTVTLTRPITIDSSITFISGIIKTDSVITLKAAATCSGASNQSFVDGPVKKIGNTAFVFPVGDEGTFFPLEISNPTTVTDAFTARYFQTTPLSIGDSVDTALTKLSPCSYWSLNRNTGTSQVYVTLHWDSIGCMMFDTLGMRVSLWDGISWKSTGIGQVNGNYNIGSIKSSTAITAYQYFTIGRNIPVTNIGMALGTFRSIPPDFFGLNGGNTIDINQNQAPNSWDNTYSFVPLGTGLKMLAPLNVDLFRYPAGTPSNYFDWRTGWHIREAQLPEGWLYNKFSLKKTPLYVGNGWDYVRDNFQLCGARPLLAWNILTSTFSQEIASVYQLGKVNLPVRYIELGNEMYLNEEHYKTIFPSVESYYEHVRSWIQDFRTLQIPQMNNVKFGVIGADVNPKETGRKRMWLPSMLDLIDAADEIDAITIHDYIGVGYDDETDGCLTSGAPYLWKYLNKAMIESEKIQQNTFSLIQQANSGKLASHPLQIWLTEYNNLEKKNSYIGTWPHGLVNALMTLRYLETPEITKITSHTMLSDGVFGNLFESTSGFNSIPCHGAVNSATNKGEFTAIGNALNVIAAAMKDAEKANPIIFSGNVNVIDMNDPSNPFPALYGWSFEYPGGNKEIIILNLDFSSTNYLLSIPSGIFNSATLTSETYNSAIVQEVVYGNATSSNTNLTKAVATYSTQSPQISLPSGSLVRIYETQPLIAELTDEEICSGSSTSLLIRGGAPPYTASGGNLNFQDLDVGSQSEPGKKLVEAPNVITNANYTITVTDNNGATTTCTLTVHPPITGFNILYEATQNPAEIAHCYDPVNGQNILLSALFTAGAGGTINNNYSYIWTPDTGIVSTCSTNALSLAALCSDIDVNPQRTTDYTVFITDGQCWDSKSVKVVVPVSKVDLGPDIVVCSSSNQFTLKAEVETESQNPTYSWSTGATTASITVDPSSFSPGEYTYTLTVSGTYQTVNCAKQDDITIRVLECCTSSVSLVPTEKEVPNTEYIDCYSNGDELYNLVAQSANCTWDQNGQLSNNNEELTIIAPSSPIVINGELRLGDDIKNNGNLLYDGYDVVIKNAILQFGPQSFIRLRGGRTLTLENCTLTNCGTPMWDGLRIFGESTDAGPYLIMKNCTLSHAATAVQLANDAQYEIENCRFDDNYIDISCTKYQQKIQQGKTGQGSTARAAKNYIRSNTFTSSGTTLLSPYNTVHKFAAIVLDDVERVVVGDSSTNGVVSENVFSGSRYGVVSRNSSVEFFNGTMSDLTGYSEEWPSGWPLPLPELKRNTVGIYNVSAFDYSDRHLWVGERNYSPGQINTFENLYFGIWSENETNVEVHNSSFGDGTVDEVNGVNCIRIYRPGNKLIDVSRNNNYYNYRFGIRIWAPSSGSTINISENKFYNGFTVNNQFTGTAVYMNDWGGVQPKWATIRANIFGDVNATPTLSTLQFPRIGIRAANIFNTLTIEENEFSFDLSNVPADYYTGIWLMNCPKTKILGNVIENMAAPSTIEDFNNNLVGVNIQNSMFTCIDDQSFTYLGQPLRFFGNSILQSLSNNTMDHFSQGVFLDLAEIGQVIPGVNTFGGNSYVDWLNTWIQPVGADEKRRIGGRRTVPIPIDWWHSAANNTDSKFPGGDASLVQERQIPSNSTVLQGSLCPVEDGSEPPFDLTSRNANFGAVAADTARYETDIEKNRYESSLELFSLLKAYPSLLDFGDTSDIGFVDFYENQLGSNIEKVVDIMNHLKQADYANGYALLSELIDTCEWETNFKLVTSAYLNTLTTGQAFTSRDSVVLDSVAHLNVYSYGVPVQFARNILDLEIYDAPSGGARKAQPRKVIRELDYLVLIPNPAHDVVKIKIPDDEIIVETILLDPIGKVIYHQNALSSLNIGHLREGIYQVQVKTHHKTRIGKLVIIK